MRIFYNSNIVITGTLLENSKIYKGKIEVAGRKKNRQCYPGKDWQ